MNTLLVGVSLVILNVLLAGALFGAAIYCFAEVSVALAAVLGGLAVCSVLVALLNGVVTVPKVVAEG